MKVIANIQQIIKGNTHDTDFIYIVVYFKSIVSVAVHKLEAYIILLNSTYAYRLHLDILGCKQLKQNHDMELWRYCF